MTEPNEPKIVHFPPRAQAPAQDTAGNWEPDEQLFGLEELLQQLPAPRLHHQIRIHKRHAQRLGAQHAHRALAAARHTDQNNVVH